jgi:hypothetical protein
MGGPTERGDQAVVDLVTRIAPPVVAFSGGLPGPLRWDPSTAERDLRAVVPGGPRAISPSRPARPYVPYRTGWRVSSA